MAPSSQTLDYAFPKTLNADDYYLSGSWQLVDDERQVLRGDKGSIGINALAGEVNLVLGTEEEGARVTAKISVDGKAYKTIAIDHHDLYQLYKGAYGRHDVVVEFEGSGVAGYAFTFGQ